MTQTRPFAATGVFCALLLAGAAAALEPPAPAARQALLIVVDGLNPEAIARAPAPHIHAFAGTAAVSLVARAVEIPSTLPGFVTMVTGLPPSLHGIDWNVDRESALALPTVFTRVHEAGGVSALYFGKSKLTMLAAPGTASVRRGPAPQNVHWERGAGPRLAAEFIGDLTRQRFDFALLHLREPDFHGHDAGWMSERYLEAVRETDAAVGQVLAALAASAQAATTTVLLVSDHGGRGTHHRPRDDETWRVPWMCRAPGRPPTTIRHVPTLADVAPTLLAAMGLPALPNAAGRAVKECL